MQINLLSILFAAILSMVLGALWYGPLFGTKWMEIIGVSAKDTSAREKMQKAAGPLYFIQFMLTLVQVVILSIFIQALELSAALIVSFFIWLGFIVPTLAGSAMWNNDTKKIQRARFLIQSGYQLLSFIIFAIVISLL